MIFSDFLQVTGDYLRIIALVVFFAFALVYAYRTSWERTQFGRHMMQSTVSHILLLSLATGFYFFDTEYNGYLIVRVLVYIFVTYVAISRFRIMFNAQKSNVDPALPDEPAVIEKLVESGEVSVTLPDKTPEQETKAP